MVSFFLQLGYAVLTDFEAILGCEFTIPKNGYDIYQMSSHDDLQKFFDRYLYGETNDWESTAKV